MKSITGNVVSSEIGWKIVKPIAKAGCGGEIKFIDASSKGAVLMSPSISVDINYEAVV